MKTKYIYLLFCFVLIVVIGVVGYILTNNESQEELSVEEYAAWCKNTTAIILGSPLTTSQQFKEAVKSISDEFKDTTPPSITQAYHTVLTRYWQESYEQYKDLPDESRAAQQIEELYQNADFVNWLNVIQSDMQKAFDALPVETQNILELNDCDISLDDAV